MAELPLATATFLPFRSATLWISESFGTTIVSPLAPIVAPETTSILLLAAAANSGGVLPTPPTSIAPRVQRLEQRRAGGERLPLDLVRHVVQRPRTPASRAFDPPFWSPTVSVTLERSTRPVLAHGVGVVGRPHARSRPAPPGRGRVRARAPCGQGGQEVLGASCGSASGRVRGWSGSSTPRAASTSVRMDQLRRVLGVLARAATVDRPLAGDPPSSSTSTRSASASASSTSWVTSRMAGRCRSQSCSDEAVHLDAGQGVERAERLVEQQQLGLADQGAGQRDPLRLAAGQRAAARRRPSRSRPTSARAPRVLDAGCAPRRVEPAPARRCRWTLRHGSSRGSWKATETRR